MFNFPYLNNISIKQLQSSFSIRKLMMKFIEKFRRQRVDANARQKLLLVTLANLLSLWCSREDPETHPYHAEKKCADCERKAV